MNTRPRTTSQRRLLLDVHRVRTLAASFLLTTTVLAPAACRDERPGEVYGDDAGASVDAGATAGWDAADNAERDASLDAGTTAGRDATGSAELDASVNPGSGRTYFIDSVGGNNSNSGTAATSAWKDFANINGKTLQAGDKLLLKRGSVFRQELRVTARGTSDNWAEVGAYGTGARPIIQRDWSITDRCALVENPDFLRVSSLVVSYAAKGLVVHYSEAGHQGLRVEDVIAHHIEGRYRLNCNGISEWTLPATFQPGTDDDDGLKYSAGVAVLGAGAGLHGATDITVQNCEQQQTTAGLYFGDYQSNATIDRNFCHANYILNGSPHPFLQSLRSSILENSVFDAAGYHASAGTMSLFVSDPVDLTIRNCFFTNQPYSNSHDEGGIDFELNGNRCVVDSCTFRNNAGAAIEVLGFSNPQVKNLEVKNSRFIKDNAHLSVQTIQPPAEVLIYANSGAHGSGTIHDNAYVLASADAGLAFFANQNPDAGSWALSGNTKYATEAALEAAASSSYNKPPVVEAGADQRVGSLTVQLAGSVVDDGLPTGGSLTKRWEVLEGPGSVAFQSDADPATTATFSSEGDYRLRLVGDDGELWTSDTVEIHVLPHGAVAAASWEFNTPVDKEGWSESGMDPGNAMGKPQNVGNTALFCNVTPVKYVGGGYYIVAMLNATDPQLLSPILPATTNVDLSKNKTIRLRFQNTTGATQGKIYFQAQSDTGFTDARSEAFAITTNDKEPHVYVLKMSSPNWTGLLKQIRFDVQSSSPLTGTIRLDYISIDDS